MEQSKYKVLKLLNFTAATNLKNVETGSINLMWIRNSWSSVLSTGQSEYKKQSFTFEGCPGYRFLDVDCKIFRLWSKRLFKQNHNSCRTDFSFQAMHTRLNTTTVTFNNTNICWTDDEVGLLLHVTWNYKSEKIQMRSQLNCDRANTYTFS